MPQPSQTLTDSVDLVFATRDVVGRWLKAEAAIAIAQHEHGIVISPELALHVAGLLLNPPHRP